MGRSSSGVIRGDRLDDGDGAERGNGAEHDGVVEHNNVLERDAGVESGSGAMREVWDKQNSGAECGDSSDCGSGGFGTGTMRKWRESGVKVGLWCDGGGTMADGDTAVVAQLLAVVQRRGRVNWGGGVEVGLRYVKNVDMVGSNDTVRRNGEFCVGHVGTSSVKTRRPSLFSLVSSILS